MSSSALPPVALAALPAARRPEEARCHAVLILDLRGPRQRGRGRIPGSHALPAGRLISGEPPEGDLILVADSNHQAVAVADALHRNGYDRRLRHLDGGFPAWEAAGLPVLRPESGRRRLLEIAWNGLLATVATFSQSLGGLALGLIRDLP